MTFFVTIVATLLLKSFLISPRIGLLIALVIHIQPQPVEDRKC